MSQIIAVTSGKGGAGKSFTSVGIATALSCLKKKVIILELDVGLRCIDVMLGIENKIVYDLGDVINENCNISDAIVKTNVNDYFDYIPAPTNIDTNFDFENALQCIRVLRRMNYDYIIIDTPAGVGLSLLSIRKLSDLAIIVTTPDLTCVRDGAKVASLLESYDFKNYKLIINKVQKQSFKNSPIHNLDDVMDGVGASLLGVIPLDAQFEKCMFNGIPLSSNDKILSIFTAIAKRIEGEYVSLIIEKI